MANDSLKKAAVLTGLTVLMGGAEVSRADATTMSTSETDMISLNIPGSSPSPLVF